MLLDDALARLQRLTEIESAYGLPSGLLAADSQFDDLSAPEIAEVLRNLADYKRLFPNPFGWTAEDED